MKGVDNCLILKSNGNSFEETVSGWFRSCGHEVISIDDIANTKSMAYRIIMMLKLCNSIRKNQYEKIIVFEKFGLFFMLNVFFCKNAFLWLWNTTEESTRIKVRFLLSNRNKIYSFDSNQSKRLKIKWNSQFYRYTEGTIKEYTYDIYFIGDSKGRYSRIVEIADYCRKNDISFLLQVYSKSITGEFIINNFIDYSEVVHNIEGSKAVLELTKEGQYGMTLRGLEALFLKKKLITDNKCYVNIPHYDKNNVFIIGYDDIAGLNEFLEKDYIDTDMNNRNYYSVEKWISRFV